jgi:prophage regulatory protein
MARYTKQVVSKKELKTVCGIPYSPQHIARLEAAGKFPKRIQLGQNRVAWLLTEVEEWIDARIASRDATVPSKGQGTGVAPGPHVLGELVGMAIGVGIGRAIRYRQARGGGIRENSAAKSNILGLFRNRTPVRL